MKKGGDRKGRKSQVMVYGARSTTAGLSSGWLLPSWAGRVSSPPLARAQKKGKGNWGAAFSGGGSTVGLVPKKKFKDGREHEEYVVRRNRRRKDSKSNGEVLVRGLYTVGILSHRVDPGPLVSKYKAVERGMHKRRVWGAE